MGPVTSRSEEGISVEIRAFPSGMSEHVSKTVRQLARGQVHSPSEAIAPVRVAQALLHIPYRVYYDERRLLALLDDGAEAGLVARCLGTRHHNGVLRERCLRHLLAHGASWTAPFVIQLLGEYVLEVVRPIHERFMDGVEEKYGMFFNDNAGYCQRLEQRAISYWNAYYRRQFSCQGEYPGVRALKALQQAAESLEQVRT